MGFGCCLFILLLLTLLAARSSFQFFQLIEDLHGGCLQLFSGSNFLLQPTFHVREGFVGFAFLDLAHLCFLFDAVVQHVLLLVNEDRHILHGLLERHTHGSFFRQPSFQRVETFLESCYLSSMHSSADAHHARRRLVRSQVLSCSVASPRGLDLDGRRRAEIVLINLFRHWQEHGRGLDR